MYLKKSVHQVGHWLRLYYDARSVKHQKKFQMGGKLEMCAYQYERLNKVWFTT